MGNILQATDDMRYAMRGVRRRLSSLLCLGALLAAPACASTSYMGLSMIPGEAAPELQALAQRAQAGDKQAQLDLGSLHEAAASSFV